MSRRRRQRRLHQSDVEAGAVAKLRAEVESGLFTLCPYREWRCFLPQHVRLWTVCFTAHLPRRPIQFTASK